MSSPQIPVPDRWSKVVPWLKAQENRFKQLSSRAGHPDPNIRKIYAGKAETLGNVIEVLQSIQKQ